MPKRVWKYKNKRRKSKKSFKFTKEQRQRWREQSPKSRPLLTSEQCKPFTEEDRHI